MESPTRNAECHKDRKHFAKGFCRSCYNKEYGRINREKMNEKSRSWAKANPQKIKAIKRKYLYGIDAETVKARELAQDGKCKICQIATAEHLDHNHETGQPRGLLCGNCNRALGLFYEDKERLHRAIMYLELWEEYTKTVVNRAV